MATTEPITLTVHGALTYPVTVGAGLLHDALPRFVAERDFSRVAVITNDTVAPLYGHALAERLPRAFLVSVPDGEQHKTLATVQTLYDALLAGGMDRAGVVIALGGGVVGDMAGFAAATFMRGVALIQTPTTLLAMVDASIGGKVGVDLPQGKNLVGAFKDPLAVFADTDTLATLPPVEFRCGLAEVVKSALVGDVTLWEHLRTRGAEPVATLIARAADVKRRVVEEDRLERGVRAYLNLGHTFAHALEQRSRYAWKHGEAVAVGLVAAARLSERLGLCKTGLAAQVEALLGALGLPTRYRRFDPAELWDAMRHDKKWQGGAARFVLLEGVARPVIVPDAPRADVLAVLETLRETDA